MLAAGEGDLGEGDLLRLLEGLADYGEGLSLGVVFRRDEVGLLEELGVDVALIDELSDLHGVLGGDAKLLELFGLDGDVLALAVLVAFDDLVLLDDGGGRFAFLGGIVDRGGEHLLVADAFAGLAGDLVEADFALGFGRDVELDAELNERDLDLTGPVRAYRHGLASRSAVVVIPNYKAKMSLLVGT